MFSTKAKYNIHKVMKNTNEIFGATYTDQRNTPDEPIRLPIQNYVFV